jgi:hypothetical protein
VTTILSTAYFYIQKSSTMKVLSLAVLYFCVYNTVTDNVCAFTATRTTTTTTTTSLYETVEKPKTTTTTKIGVERNPNFAKLAGGYLFPEIGRRRNEYIQNNPEVASRIISLGIGDTTQPIPEHILGGLQYGANKLGVKASYTGYGNEQGNTNLREKIAKTLYNGLIDTEEVFVSGTFDQSLLWDMGYDTTNLWTEHLVFRFTFLYNYLFEELTSFLLHS